MDESHWTRLGAVFEAALTRPPAARGRFVAEACAGNETMRRELESLLAAHADAGGEFMDDAQVARLVQTRREPSRPPERIGPWRVLEEIGRGGMGVVYEARRADGQFDQTAALKLTRSGLDGDRYLEHFLRERQILARMDHAGIARLLDGGVTPDGRPWFALERVHGVSLTMFSDQQNLDTRARLRLLADVCAAVEYAHRRLVVHRDLKPSNVLVNAEGQIKLLDFGIAKMLRHAHDETRAEAPTLHVGTPGYGAPELLGGGIITTATDVFSLGIMMRELLYGASPTGTQGGRDDEEHPRIPDRDLETIAAKATRLEPERRYVSAEALREDIERYLRDEPVRARPDALGYRAKKFVTRHRTSVVAAGLALLSLVAGLGTALWQAGVAARERDIAREETEQKKEVRDFLIDLFRATDPDDRAGTVPTAENLLERGLGRVRTGLEERPELRVELLSTIGQVAATLGDYERAHDLFTEAASIDLGSEGRDQLRLAVALDGLGVTAAYRGEFELAAQHHRRALAIRAAFADPDSPDVAQSLNNLGAALAAHRDLPEAIERYRQAIEVRERSAGPDARVTLETLGNLGAALRHQENYLEAERILGRVVERMTAQGWDRHPSMVVMLSQLGTVKARLGDVQAAARLNQQSFELSRAYWGEAHPNTRIEMNNYALAAHVLGQDVEAETWMRKTLELDIEQYGQGHAFVAIGHDNLGRILVALGRVEEGLSHFARAESIYTSLPESRYAAVHQARHAVALLVAGDAAAARAQADRGLAAERARRPLDNQRLTTALTIAASVRTSLGLHADAERLYREALLLIEGRPLPHALDTGIASAGLGELHLVQGRVSEARLALERAAEAWATTLPEGHWRRVEVEVALGACDVREGQVERGRQRMDGAIEQLAREHGTTHWRTRKAVMRREAL